MVLHPDALRRTVAGDSARSAGAAAGHAGVSSSAVAAPTGAVRVLNGVNSGRELMLTKSMTTLGKPGSQVAVIARNAQGYAISHVEGASCPSVNGRPIGAQACPLKDRDVIEVAGVRMAFSLKT